ncbi:hypothetical protein KEK_10082 [Mycolicibacterium thermoresistibile ATCC 19527]|uniref:ATP synthase I n=1 Tax=Mycolicibacterium thermoresistibile (strain ATCC 19527 / DSM 44167 / CIP 105390 / JCM 6362 / NCTC 10409 / 316) TaxID=1078020 RepID=G7CG90_MYCT3|nr:hypothetical protein KEK_10082 [Mycolicibacterium thermoresistibile ATCC 19527]
MVLPSVAFRPVRLAIICAVLGAVVLAVSVYLGSLLFGLLFLLGLAMGLGNALLVKRAALRITAQAHPLKRQMAVNSMGRLAVLSVIALAIAFLVRPAGLGVLFGLALFQLLLVLTTTLPVLKALRSGAAAGSMEGRAAGDD